MPEPFMSRAFYEKVITIAAGVLCWHAGAAELPPLTLREAHETALRNHPRISVAELTALASRQAEREARSGFLPNVSGNMVAVGAATSNTRLAAVGALNNPAIFDRAAAGLMVSQLITDFGRTANLARSAKFHAQAAEQNAQATRDDILLAVDGAFFSALQAQAVTRVAQQTVETRLILLEQTSALASNKMKSELDVSFTRVNLEDARLLLSKAQNDLEASFAQLSTLLGMPEVRAFRLVDQPLPPPVATNVADFVQLSLRSRPDLQSLRDEQQSQLSFSRAERDARYPTVAAVGTAGASPVHDEQIPDSYAAAGLTLTVPLYAGGLYTARAKEAELRAQAASEAIRDLENNIIRDVRIAWLNSQNAYERYRISGDLLANARRAFELAQARYKAGLSSIVELNQAELSEIQAEITYASTQYEYLLERSALSFQTGTLK